MLEGKKVLTKIAASGLNVYDTEDLIDEYLDPAHQENIVKEFLDLVKTGEIPISRIEESVKKVIALKVQSFCLGSQKVLEMDYVIIVPH